jgi:hypothetical protein
MINSRRDLLGQLGCVFASVSIGSTVYGPAAHAGDRPNAVRIVRTKPINVLAFGATGGDGVTDDGAAIQKAFDYAKANGLDVFIPAGTFLHSGTLNANGIKVFGEGDASILKATVLGSEAIVLTGDHAGVSSVQLIGMGGPRQNTGGPCLILVNGATNFTVENVHAKDASSGSIWIQGGAAYGYVGFNTIENSAADSIHMTNGAHDILVEGNTIRYSADDGIAVTSVSALSYNITIRDNDIGFNTWGRGIGVIGGSDVLIEHNNIVGGASQYAGIYIAAEGQWSTMADHNIRVTGNTITDAGGLHGAIQLYNSQSVVNDGITITNNDIIDPRNTGIVLTGNSQQYVAIYENTVTGSSHGELANYANAHISTTRPATETNVIGSE